MEKLFTGIDQVSFVVENVDKVVRLLADHYGIGPWLIANFGKTDSEDFNSNSVLVEDVILEGRYVGYYGARIGVCEIDGFQIELIEPLDTHSLFSKYAKEYGVGAQHISVHRSAPFSEILGIMAANGYPLSQLSLIDRREDCAFVDHMRTLGLHLEIQQRPENFKMPSIRPEFYPPDRIMKTLPLFDKVEQLAFVVEDLEKTVHLMNDVYGIGPWMLVDFGDCHDGKDFISVEDAVINGRPIGTYGVKMAVCNTLNVQIELLQPTGEEDALGRFLKERGPGLHHISIRHCADYGTTLKRIKSAGFEKGQSSLIDGQEVCSYCDHMDLLGIFLEIHHRSDHFTWPTVKPDVYPPEKI